jgi:predicted lipoprotein with Yx(FWY)xxD motif
MVKTPGGKEQVTYNHHSLYYFHGAPGYGRGDAKPGDLEGQGLFQAWFVLSPKGTPIRKQVG